MKKGIAGVMFVAAVLAMSLPVFAHHGNAAYDMNEVMLKEAKVTDFLWANPHTIITFDTKDDAGKMLHWAGELGSPSALVNLGWTKTTISKGDTITVYIHKSKTGNPVGRITHIVLADGSTFRDSGGAGAGEGGQGARGGRGGSGEY